MVPLRLLALLSIISQPAFTQTLVERDVTSLVAIRDMQITNDRIVYSYLRPCGTKPLGIFVQPGSEGKDLRLAVLVRQEGVQCAAMPTPIIDSLSVLQLKGVKRLVKMAPERVKGSVRLGRVSSLQRLKSNDQIEAVWQQSCATWQGFVLREGHNDTVGFGFVESVENATKKTCQSGERIFKPEFIHPHKAKKLYAIENPLPVEQAFHIRLAPIERIEAARTISSGRMQIRYLKRCDEAPIGIVVGGPSASQTMPVGMVVAHFYNRACDKDEPKVSAYEYASQTYPIKPGTKVTAIPASKGFGDFRIKAPLQFGFVDEELQIRFYGRCRRDVGVMYGQDEFGRMSIGVLEMATANFGCNKPTMRLSLKQPYFLKAPAPVDHFPMKVEGATIY